MNLIFITWKLFSNINRNGYVILSLSKETRFKKNNEELALAETYY